MVTDLDSSALGMRDRCPSGGRHRPLLLDIVRDDGDWGALSPVEPLVEHAVRAVARHVPPSGRSGCATLVLSSDERMRALNRTWRGRDQATNVLSFPAVPLPGAPAAATPFLGDIVLAGETLLREAAEQGIEPSHHFQHLLVHGILHLLGYDHETDAQAQIMEGLEIGILASLGIASPYADEEGKRAPRS
jgi:probable rRNA maturation factor